MKRHRLLFCLCFCFLLLFQEASSLPIPSLFVLRGVSATVIKKEVSGGNTRFFLKKKDITSKSNFEGKHDNENSSKDSTTSKRQSSHHPQQGRQVRLILPPIWSRMLYLFTAINPALAVLFNDYSKMIEPIKEIQTHNRLAAAYETIFFFARLKPRVSFAIGAILRALQLTTAFQYVFDPMAGVGLGLNAICLFAKSRWPATIVLGWSITKPFWKVLGACPPSGLPVPITVSFRKVEDSGPDMSRAGYSLGLRS